MTTSKKSKIVKDNVLHGELRIAELGQMDRPGLATWDRAVSLAHWANLYMRAEVVGILADNTAKAKKRDLIMFMDWFYESNGHLEISDWLPRDTKGFIDNLEAKGRAATTVNRFLATLRTFARWCHDQKESPFLGGLPTKGIKDREVEEPTAKKIEAKEINRLFKAADRLVVTDTRKNARPKRARAIFALLYYTGLRVSELCALELAQYTGKHLINVRRKGRSRTRKMYVSTDCRVYLDDYIATERKTDHMEGVSGSLFLTCKNWGLTPVTVWRGLERLSREANRHHKDEIKIHPHRLRHTFGFEVRKRTGSDTETAALLGHAGLKYVGRYVRNTDEEREKILDDL